MSLGAGPHIAAAFCILLAPGVPAADPAFIDRALDVSESLCIASMPDFQDLGDLAADRDFTRYEDDDFVHYFDPGTGNAVRVTFVPPEKVLGLTLTPPQCVVSVDQDAPEQVLAKLDAHLAANYDEVVTPFGSGALSLTVGGTMRMVRHPEHGAVQIMILPVQDDGVVALSISEPY